jgi:hypothetical protein
MKPASESVPPDELVVELEAELEAELAVDPVPLLELAAAVVAPLEELVAATELVPDELAVVAPVALVVARPVVLLPELEVVFGSPSSAFDTQAVQENASAIRSARVISWIPRGKAFPGQLRRAAKSVTAMCDEVPG